MKDSDKKSRHHNVIDAQLLALLGKYDTPTICNAMEIAAPERPRSLGYTRRSLVAADPSLPPMIGYARTATIRAVVGVSPEEKRRKALEYYEYTAGGPGPTIVVVQDVDSVPGIAAWWGEVHTALHQGLGSLGAITKRCYSRSRRVRKRLQLVGRLCRPKPYLCPCCRYWL